VSGVCLKIFVIFLLMLCAAQLSMCGCVGQSPLRMRASAACAAMGVVCAAAGECGSRELLCACEVVGRWGSESGGRRELFGKAACSSFPRGRGAIVGFLWMTAAWLCELRS